MSIMGGSCWNNGAVLVVDIAILVPRYFEKHLTVLRTSIS